MKTNELREMSKNELEARRRDLCQENFHLRMQQAAGQLEKPSLMRDIRREVARIETILSERRNSAEKEAK